MSVPRNKSDLLRRLFKGEIKFDERPTYVRLKEMNDDIENSASQNMDWRFFRESVLPVL